MGGGSKTHQWSLFTQLLISQGSTSIAFICWISRWALSLHKLITYTSEGVIDSFNLSGGLFF